MTHQQILDDVTAERGRQYDKWGIQHHPNGTDERDKWMADYARHMTDDAAMSNQLTWFDILREEFYEAGAETEWPKLRAELIQVAAVCAAWIQDGDERH
jgi:hypothetical protein